MGSLYQNVNNVPAKKIAEIVVVKAMGSLYKMGSHRAS
jgi:hypothetical protein